MKKFFAAILSVALCLSVAACGGAAADANENDNTETGATLVSRTVVEPTCLTEGYTEKVYSDGYVCRDTFVPKTDHKFEEYRLGADPRGLVRSACRYCGTERVSYVLDDISTDVTVDPARPRPKFTARDDRMIVAMIQETTADDCIRSIRAAEQTGAYGFMVYVSNLIPQEQTFGQIQRIMYCTDLPVLAIAYGAGTHEQMASLLKLSVSAGAAAVDMQGFMWVNGDIKALQRTYRSYWEERGYDMSFVSSAPAEVCTQPSALEKQAQFIREIHALGGEVLVSMHVGVAMKAEQIVALAQFTEGVTEGVDVIKIVLTGGTKDTVVEHLKACITLEKTLKCKFSVHGQSTLSRIMCPMFGSYIAFCVDDYDTVATSIQADLQTMADLFKGGEPSCDLQTLVELFDSPDLRGDVR